MVLTLSDHLSHEARSKHMGRIRQKNTKPELLVRQYLYSLGYRYRLHRIDLPGSPDIVLPKYKLAIFVHGCFWHHHPGCKRAKIPKSRKEWWSKKFKNNQMRDARAIKSLKDMGWKVKVVWECETNDFQSISNALGTIIEN